MWGLSWCREYQDVGSITVWGASWCGEHLCVGSISVWGASLRGEHLGVEMPGPAGKRQREASEHLRGEPEKTAAASQAALGEAQQSFAGAKTT